MTVAEQPIKDLLFKEAKKKREHRIRAEQNDILFVEASERIQDTGPKPMARQSGGSTLKNSGWNTDWDFVDPAPDIERIKNEVKQRAMGFFQSLQSQQASQVDLRPNPLSFVFKYIRTVIPDNNDEANQKALNSLQILDQLLPGFRQFQQDIESSNIPLSPYFMTSNFSKQNGRVTPDQLGGFLQQEAGKEMKLPDERQLPTGNHYKEHVGRIQQGESVRVSDYPNVFRVYSMSEVDNIPNSSWLIQAIDDKIDSGYAVDFRKVHQFLQQLLQAKLQANGLEQPASPEQEAEKGMYNNHYEELYQEMGAWWSDRESSDLMSFSLKIILKSMQHTGSGIPEVAPDEFRVKRATTPYYSNGWDSSADNPQMNMLTVPPLRQLPRGEVVYDRGNGNMSYDHLILNWKGGLDQVLTRWGAKADEWMRILQQGETMETIAQQSPEVFEAWKNTISMQTGNRTGAEALVDMLTKYPDWNQFNQNHLQKSLASEIRTVNALLKEGWDGQQRFSGQNYPGEITQLLNQIIEAAKVDPVEAAQQLKSASAELAHLYQKEQIDWDFMTMALNYLNQAHHRTQGVEGNGLSGPRASERRSMIDEAGFGILKQYGYQVGKMMDFLYAVMTRCCHENVNTRWNGAEENFYGHQYSTSSGKSAGGDIILEVSFNQLNARVVDQGVEVVEKLSFTMGQRTGAHDPIILRQRKSWQQVVNDFHEMQPEAWYHASVINEPMNRNLEILEIAIKEALNEVRNNIQVTYIDSDGKAFHLSGEELASDKMEVNEDAGKTDLIEDSPAPEAPQSEVSDETTFDSTYFGESTPPDYDSADHNVNEETIPPTMTPTTPPEEQKIQPKSLEQEPLSFLQKRKNDKRRLFREKTRNAPAGVMSTLGSIEDRLLKAANRLDEHGEVQVADKIDVLLQKLCEVKYVRETSRLQIN